MTDQKAKIIKGRVIIALHEVLGRKPTAQEIERYYRAVRVIYSTLMPPTLERLTQNKQKRQRGNVTNKYSTPVSTQAF